MRRYIVSITILAISLSAACGGKTRYIAGTKVKDTPGNRDLIAVVEKYRLAVEEQDSDGLMLMASSKYWEDSGTVTGKDDYGYKKLREVLTGRFQSGDDLRYSLRYMNVLRRCPKGGDGNDGCRAYVDVFIDASYSVNDARGEMVRRDKRDQNQLVLEWDGQAWKFLSGM
jgi:hypothetical protein